MKIDYAEIGLFRDLPDEVLAEVIECAQVKHMDADAPVIWAGDECEAVYFILAGRVDISRLSAQGREQVLERLGPGEAFNLVPVFQRNPLNPADAKTVGPAELLCIERKEFLRLMGCHPQLTRALAAYLAGRLSNMVDLAERLALFPVRQRLAAFLINQADAVGKDAAQQWTQEDIARRLGTVRDVVGRALRRFEQEGLIRFQRQRIQLLDRERLQSLADGRE
jgi:CRP/FNR family transcriptional regulator